MKHLASARSTVRVRRPVVSENMITSAWKRGSTKIEVTPGSIITPAAKERAKSLGVSIHHSALPVRTSGDVTVVVESVLASVLAEFEGRPRATVRPSVSSASLLSAQDIEFLKTRHEKVIYVGKKTRVTPLARDLADKYGLKIKVKA
ncbi:MAG: hypothetical protein JKX97_04845 [Candidatus Lindowbacteria bacterium]|nr:hypothetical protein [Candidatus Lindowbacteria bacterium]